MRPPTAPRLVYRVVQRDPPTADDFTAPEQAGAPPPWRQAVDPRLLSGVSVTATESQAKRLARRFPALGAYVAEIELPPTARIERTLKRRGHFTVWADPEDLVRSVRRVIALA